MRVTICSIFLLLVSTVFGQIDSTLSLSSRPIVVKGRALTDLNTVVPDLFVVNKRTSIGAFADAGGNYKVSAFHSDTLIFGALGMQTLYVSFADSAYKANYNYDIVMRKLVIYIAEAEVIAPRELVAIERDLRILGYDEKDYRVSGVNAIESPITFLYQSFSRREKSKRLVAELENMDRRRELLKELFHKYVAYDIIDLQDDEFDDFIDFIDVNDAYLRGVSQYEFIELVKQRYVIFEKRGRKMKEEDFDYDED